MLPYEDHMAKGLANPIKREWVRNLDTGSVLTLLQAHPIHNQVSQ